MNNPFPPAASLFLLYIVQQANKLLFEDVVKADIICFSFSSSHSILITSASSFFTGKTTRSVN